MGQRFSSVIIKDIQMEEKAYEKMLHIKCHQQNANQNKAKQNDELSLRTC